jgi:hypothetical protein
MKHLIIFGIIILGVILLKLSYQLNCNVENFSEFGCLYPGIYIGKSNIGGKYGRGIFANKDFTIDEIIEKAPYIEDKLEKFNGVSRDYVFNTKEGKVALAFGYASLYNHNDDPNAIWYFEDERVVIKTKKPIKKEQEIFISYGNEYWKSRNHMNKIN